MSRINHCLYTDVKFFPNGLLAGPTFNSRHHESSNSVQSSQVSVVTVMIFWAVTYDLLELCTFFIDVLLIFL